MNVSYIIIDESIQCLNNFNIDDTKKRLNSFFEICDEIKQYDDEESIIYSMNIYNQLIDNTEFADWLYSSDNDEDCLSDEKRLLSIYLEQLFVMAESTDGYLNSLGSGYYLGSNLAALHMLFKIEGIPGLSVFDILDCFNVRKHFLYRESERLGFYKSLKKTFPNLYFGETVENSLRHYNPIRDHIRELIKHLSSLNDYGQSIYEECSIQGEAVVLNRLSSRAGIICSPEGNPDTVDQYLKFKFIDKVGAIHEIKCSPHTKLYRSDSNYRIYFTWNADRFPELPFILIGHIGDHPYS